VNLVESLANDLGHLETVGKIFMKLPEKIPAAVAFRLAAALSSRTGRA
jgi:hypothetical protein